MIEGLLTPPHVRNHEAYRERFDPAEAESFLDEIDGFDSAVVMGVPSFEAGDFADEVERALEEEAFNDADIYAYPDVGENLNRGYEEISYDRMGSRIADVEWTNEEFSEDEDIAVFSWDYNVRTGDEIDRRMEDHDSFGQFALDFEDFNNFNIKNYIKGLLPGFDSFWDEAEESGKSFSYEVPETSGSSVLVFNAAFSDDIDDYRGKMRSEALRHGLAKLPYGQRMKDLGKKGLDRVLGGFEY